MNKANKSSIINLNHSFQKKVVADNVANSSQLKFEMLATQHLNSYVRKTKNVVINFPTMEHVAAACSSIFSDIDRSDEIQRLIARDAWLLKTSLTLTVLPFDDARLNLRDLLNRLKIASESVEVIRPAVNDLVDIVKHLEYAKVNPKRDHLLEFLRYSQTSNQNIAVMGNVCGTSTPGWPTNFDAKSDLGCAEIEILRLRRQVRDALFDNLIIPGNPWFAPRGLLFDLLYGGRTSEAVVVSYKSERVSIPAPRELPKNIYFPTKANSAVDVPETKELDYSSQIDTWAHDSFWSSIHAQHSDITPNSDNAESVNAQFVLFADGSGTFLPVDGRVVEVSRLFDEGSTNKSFGDKLPKANVRDIEEGDLILLRLTGSGDYLEEVADALISNKGETGLRESALQWKDRLQRVIRLHGEGVVAVAIRKLGVKLRSPQYLWEWTGNEVMSPHDKQTFSSLIKVIWQLEGLSNQEDSITFADSRWDEMERLKAFHHKAGVAIRTALLSRVRGLISERRQIHMSESIELPGVASGRMGLLRVAAVDSRPRNIKSSALFQLSKLKVASWQG